MFLSFDYDVMNFRIFFQKVAIFLADTVQLNNFSYSSFQLKTLFGYNYVQNPVP
jgi:hypothetical protein